MAKNPKSYMTNWRDKRIADGICPKCGRPNPDTRYNYCPDCRAQATEKSRKKRMEWAKQGLCIYCGKRPALPGKNECGCVTKKRETTYAKRISKGVCVICGKRKIDHERSRTRCSVCLDKQVRHMRDMRETDKID